MFNKTPLLLSFDLYSLTLDRPNLISFYRPQLHNLTQVHNSQDDKLNTSILVYYLAKCINKNHKTNHRCIIWRPSPLR